MEWRVVTFARFQFDFCQLIVQFIKCADVSSWYLSMLYIAIYVLIDQIKSSHQNGHDVVGCMRIKKFYYIFSEFSFSLGIRFMPYYYNNGKTWNYRISNANRMNMARVWHHHSMTTVCGYIYKYVCCVMNTKCMQTKTQTQTHSHTCSTTTTKNPHARIHFRSL